MNKNLQIMKFLQRQIWCENIQQPNNLKENTEHYYTLVMIILWDK